jgi:hypothetical protein
MLALRVVPAEDIAGGRTNGRAYVAARARALEPLSGWQNPFGFHQLEEERYRWTERRFGFEAAVPGEARRARVRLHVQWAEASRQRYGALRGRIRLGEFAAVEFTQDTSEPVWLEAAAELQGKPVSLPVVVELAAALPPEPGDERERGVTVDSILVDFAG